MATRSRVQTAPETPDVEASAGRFGAEALDSLLAAAVGRPKRGAERKQDRSKRTAQQILNAALRVFARDGISRPKIADIAAEAGVPTSTLYEYYKSKEDLAYDVPFSYLANFYSVYRDAVQGVTSARERIILYLTTSADFAREHADWARLFYLEIWPSVFVSDTDLRHSVDDFARILIVLVRQGGEEGILDARRDPYETSSILLGGVNQLIITWLLYRRPRNLTKASHEIVQRMLAMLDAEARTAR